MLWRGSPGVFSGGGFQWSCAPVWSRRHLNPWLRRSLPPEREKESLGLFCSPTRIDTRHCRSHTLARAGDGTSSPSKGIWEVEGSRWGFAGTQGTHFQRGPAQADVASMQDYSPWTSIAARSSMKHRLPPLPSPPPLGTNITAGKETRGNGQSSGGRGSLVIACGEGLSSLVVVTFLRNRV